MAVWEGQSATDSTWDLLSSTSSDGGQTWTASKPVTQSTPIVLYLIIYIYINIYNYIYIIIGFSFGDKIFHLMTVA